MRRVLSRFAGPSLLLVLVAAACGGAAAPTATSTRAPAQPTTPAAVTPTRPVAQATTAPAATSTTPAQPTPVAGVAPKGQVTATASTLQTEYWDPTNYNAGGQTPLMDSVIDGLTRRDQDANLVPALATSWEASAQRYVFTLRPGVKFHNGATMTAADVVYTFNRVMRPESMQSTAKPQMLRFIDRIEVPDESHVVVYTKEPWALAPQVLPDVTIVPKEYTTAAGEDFKRRPVGTGPWQLVEQKPLDEYVLKAFTQVWDKARVPTVETVRIKIVPEPTVRLAQLKTGETDLAWGMGPGGAMAEILKDKSLKAVVSNEVAGCGIGPVDFARAEDSPLKDARVRQALTYAIDREAIIKTIYSGYGTIPIVDGGNVGTGVDPSLKPYPYDPAKAKQLLAEAGFPNGFSTTLNTYDNPNVVRIPDVMQAIQAYWADIGVKANVNAGEAGALIAAGRARTLKGWLSLCGGTTDLGSNLETFWADHTNHPYSYTKDAELDRLIDKSLGAVDPKEREAILNEASRLAYKLLFRIALVNGSMVYGAGPRIADWQPRQRNGNLTSFFTIKLKT